MAERVRRIQDCVCLSPFLDTLTKFLAINNTLSDFSEKKRVKNPMGAKVLLLKYLRKMSSKMTYLYYQHLKEDKNTPFRVRHVLSRFSRLTSLVSSKTFGHNLFFKTKHDLSQSCQGVRP